VGPAVLYLPRGFALSGIAVAIPAMLLATMSYLYSATRLLECWKVESEKSHLMAEKMEEIRLLFDPCKENAGGDGYGSLEDENQKQMTQSTAKLLTYPELARRAFGKASFLISGGIAAMQFGVCLTYLIFVPQNLCESTRALFGVEVPKQMFLIGMLVVEIPLCWIRDIRRLTPLNILATFFIAFGLVSVLYIALFDSNSDGGTDDYGIAEEEKTSLFQEISRLPAIKDTWFLFIGTSVSSGIAAHI